MLLNTGAVGSNTRPRISEMTRHQKGCIFEQDGSRRSRELGWNFSLQRESQRMSVAVHHVGIL